MLEMRRLGRSDLEITKVGIGTAPLGSTPNWRVYWGPQDEKTAIRAIQTALDTGVNWIDTAPFYGWGKAEEIVGKAVKERREEVYIFTKCGTIPDGKGGSTENLKPDMIKREVEASLGRLQTDYIDLLERAMKVGPVTSNQVQYNPLQRKIEKDILPFSQRNSIGVLGWGSLAEGFLTDNFSVGKLDPKDFRRNHWYAQPENQAKVARVRDTLARIARAHNKPMVDVVVAWELTHPALTGAIIGIRSEKEAKEMTGGTELLLTRDEMQEIDKASS